MRLLLVEDNDRLAQLVVKGLSEAGFTVDRVARLDEAAAALATGKFDTVVLDLSLPSSRVRPSTPPGRRSSAFSLATSSSISKGLAR